MKMGAQLSAHCEPSWLPGTDSNPAHKRDVGCASTDPDRVVNPAYSGTLPAEPLQENVRCLVF